MEHNGADKFGNSHWHDPEDEWSMETDEVMFRNQFGRPGTRGEAMMKEKIIHKDFYNDFGDLFDPDSRDSSG